MPRETVSLTLPDVSRFTASLRADLGDHTPSHQTLLNAVARAGGFRNFQHLKATQTVPMPPEPVDGRAVSRALARFDDHGAFAGWSTKRKVRTLCLWALWAQLPARTTFDERTISAFFDGRTTFHDAAQIRRSLIEEGLLWRTADGSQYRRLERRPDATTAAVIGAVTARRAANG